MKSKLVDCLFAGAKSRREREENYLEKAVSMEDLDRREREIRMGRFR